MIDLPDYPAPNGATAGLVDFGVFLQPPLGGPVQRVERMGNRFRLSVSYPPMPNKAEGRKFVSRLIRGKTEGVRLEYPLLGFDPGLPGTNAKVHGSGQTGTALIVKFATPNYVYREGQPISIETGGRHHLYFVTAEAVASSGDGTAALSLTPMLRVAHLDNDAVHIAKPMIEGFIMGDEFSWNMSIDHNIELGFEVVEAA